MSNRGTLSIVTGEEPDHPSRFLIWVMPRIMLFGSLMAVAAAAVAHLASTFGFGMFNTALLGVGVGAALVGRWGERLL